MGVKIICMRCMVHFHNAVHLLHLQTCGLFERYLNKISNVVNYIKKPHENHSQKTADRD